jgi:hypothetical protein
MHARTHTALAHDSLDRKQATNAVETWSTSWVLEKEGVSHLDTFAHSKHGIAYQDKGQWP